MKYKNKFRHGYMETGKMVSDVPTALSPENAHIFVLKLCFFTFRAHIKTSNTLHTVDCKTGCKWKTTVTRHVEMTKPRFARNSCCI